MNANNYPKFYFIHNFENIEQKKACNLSRLIKCYALTSESGCSGFSSGAIAFSACSI
jgi:hypothetical protein